ncbi:MAG: T9SS type A sorting domain-containing protein, partial [Ignavibacteria bacterium]|nr:T9SS type A sorting domain-containing protein [Ignavibacteria bacterium]
SQNYPNPFNPETVISYQLPVNSKVSLKVFDILGKEVAILVNEEKPAGKYQVNFNGSILASGVYFYKLSANGGAGSFSQTRKFVLLK